MPKARRSRARSRTINRNITTRREMLCASSADDRLKLTAAEREDVRPFSFRLRGSRHRAARFCSGLIARHRGITPRFRFVPDRRKCPHPFMSADRNSRPPKAVSYIMNCETQEEIDPATAGLGEAHRWRQEGDTDDEARSRKVRESICRKVTMTCLRFMFLLCKTFQACAVATTKSDA